MNIENNIENYWNEIFLNKDTTKVSWFQSRPKLSLNLIEEYASSKGISIIDVGGGDSRLPDCLFDIGYRDISVLDISKRAIMQSQKRLAKISNEIEWIVSNVLDFTPNKAYDIWHDRAVFHFLINFNDQINYKNKLIENLSKEGTVLIGGFSKMNGPKKCSGLEIQQHDRESMILIFQPEFEITHDFEAIHETPSGSNQNFYWAIMKLSSATPNG